MTAMGRIDYEVLEKDIKLDVKDRRILSLLAENSRTPLTQIAKHVRLSRDAVNYRIKRLEKAGVILSFFANLNFEKLGYYVFHIFLLIDEMDHEAERALVEYLKGHPNIFSVIEYSDRWDIEAAVVARDLLEFDRIMLEISEKFPEIIVEKDKLEIIRHFNAAYLPPLLQDSSLPVFPLHRERAPRAAVDETDLRLLRLLCADARASTYEMGKSLGLSPDAVSYRIKHLLEEGVIRNFTILANLSMLKYHWYTYSIEMKMFNLQNEQKFEAFLAQNRNILRSVKTLGGWDLLLYIVVENPREFHRIVKDIKNVFSAVIRNYQTWVAYKEHNFKPMPEALTLVAKK